MKEKLKNIKLWSALALLLTAASCQRDPFPESVRANADEYTVTLNIGLEDLSSVTRGGEDSDYSIGRGSQIDMLVYAVYYDNNKDEDNPDWKAATEYAGDESPWPDDVSIGYGQTIVDVADVFKNGGYHTMTLTLKKDYNYRVVFWAQNHKTKAFVIDDLKRVQMKYKVADNPTDDADSQQIQSVDNDEESEDDESDTGSQQILSVNNDEARDAFCRYIELDAETVNNNDITVNLRRPLAQINVGTRGFDYETITRNAVDKYLYSKVRINRVARYLNVVEDKIYTNTGSDDNYTGEGTEAFYTVDYDYNVIPAYWKWKDDESVNYPHYPKFPSYTIYDYKAGDFDKIFHHLGDEDIYFEDGEGFAKLYGQEEFLKVHLFDTEGNHQDNGNIPDDYTDPEVENDPNSYYTYARMGVAGNEEGNRQSEVFKYLSMCYVLVPTSQDGNNSYTLNNFKMWLATEADEKGLRKEIEVINLNNVPVQRNRRTNIVGSLLTAKADVIVTVDKDFAGNKIQGDNVVSGEIHEGFYFNAEKNEFEISSREGLLFFQRLVNGNVTVRQITDDTYDPNTNVKVPVTLGGSYPYMDKSGNVRLLDAPKAVTYGGLELDEQKAQILLKGVGLYDYVPKTDSDGTSYYAKDIVDYKVTSEGKEITTTYTIKVDLDDKTKWPKQNNFSFYGCKVRLVADIDMSGIEWIPIGFDCCSWDSSIGTNDTNTSGKNNAYSVKNTSSTNHDEIGAINYRSLIKYGTNEIDLKIRRVFCGTFDGDNHTIYNLHSKEFGNQVLAYNRQYQDKNGTNGGPYDNVQWFGRGFFGLCGPGVSIKNVRLQNVNISGNNGVAGLVAVVNSPCFVAQIKNCVVDGGKIRAVPLYRYDYNDTHYYGRTFARGVYVAGIVGQFSAFGDESGVTDCEVRNVTISGFRRVGGIIGSIADQGNESMDNKYMQVGVKVEKNRVSNSLILCNQFTPFNYVYNQDYYSSSVKDGVWRNGFGWGASGSTSPMSDKIVGGMLDMVNSFEGEGTYKPEYAKGPAGRDRKMDFYDTYIPGNNNVYNVSYSILSVRPNETGLSDLRRMPELQSRECSIENIPLEEIPIFSSLFVDEVSLTSNYYGKSNIRTKINFQNNTHLWCGPAGEKAGFRFPMEFPDGNGINYDETFAANSRVAGMYLESVYLSGEKNDLGRAVITPSGVDGEHSCVLYVTARDFKQFENKLDGRNSSAGKTLSHASPAIKNVVLRGDPYGWAGVLFAPNANMSSVELDNVTIYDVYQTLAIEDAVDDLDDQTIQNYTYWQNYSCSGDANDLEAKDDVAQIPLSVKNSNLRGYTFPGKGWSQITYDNTTFEQGAETRYSHSNSDPIHNLYYPDRDGTEEQEIDGTKQKCSLAKMQRYKVCRVDAATVFNNCTFKAPFFIDLSHTDSEVSFNNCVATSTYSNVAIEFDDDDRKINGHKVYFIEIYSDQSTGETVVRYYGMKEGDSPSEDNLNEGFWIDEVRRK